MPELKSYWSKHLISVCIFNQKCTEHRFVFFNLLKDFSPPLCLEAVLVIIIFQHFSQTCSLELTCHVIPVGEQLVFNCDSFPSS